MQESAINKFMGQDAKAFLRIVMRESISLGDFHDFQIRFLFPDWDAPEQALNQGERDTFRREKPSKNDFLNASIFFFNPMKYTAEPFCL